MHLKPELKEEVKALLDKEGWNLGYRYVARKLGRGHHPVLETLRELRGNLFNPPEVEIPIEWDDERPTIPNPPPEACRIHVEKPVANYTWAPLDCGKELERVLLLPDTHSKYHDPYAWRAALNFARIWHPDTIVHLGDLSDFYAVSDHDKDPRQGHNLIEECAVTNALLDELDGLKPRRKVFCQGNHEYRLERHLMRHSPALLGAVSVDSLLRFQERGWIHVPYGQHGRLGNLHVTHDVGKSGVNAVHQTATAVGHNIAFGHTHRLAAEYFGTALGDRYVSASLGWLGDFEAARYVSNVTKAAWSHGFGIAYMDRRGDFELQLKPIVAGRVIAT